MTDIDYDEVNTSQYPAVELLVKLGWKYISRDEALAARDGDNSRVILTSVATDALMRINDFELGGVRRKFDENDIAAKVDELENTEIQGLIDTSREISNRIMPKLGGGTIKVFTDGSYQDKSIRYIDFDHPENNDYHVTAEYKVAGNEENIRCDIVLFVNGIPIAEIENKKPSVGYKKAIQQLRRYQQKEFCPKLAAFTQLLIAMDGEHAEYGTAGTTEEFYTHWREKDADDATMRAEIDAMKVRPMSNFEQIKTDLNGYVSGNDAGDLPQDILIYGMLRPDRILDIAKNFVFYDGLHKKVARYQQYFAIKKMITQVEQREKDDSRRKGGIVWHTQGSGKSLTMVMFVRALIENSNIVNPRVIIVTDRVDLDKQIKQTFADGGLKKNVVRTTSGEDLLKRIQKKDDGVLTTIIDKFESAARKRGTFTDLDDNIFVLIDEAHRSQTGEANFQMLQTIPNACYIAFTGTPILTNQKKLTVNKFGGFIDKYTIDDALADGVIVPLLYQARDIQLDQDAEKIDRKTDRVMEDLTKQQKHELKRKAERKLVKNASARIEEICYDIAEHYAKEFQNTGLKAQIVAPGKLEAVHMQEWFKADGKIKTALVISDGNGEIGEDEKEKLEVKAYLDKIKQNYTSLKSYEERVIEDFKKKPGPEILIVVNKLLTGFDAPPNTVLYLAKQLRDHDLLQAIARVNRIYNNPHGTKPKTAGYVIDYSENAASIKAAMALFGNYDAEDVRGALTDAREKQADLESKYAELLDMFKTFGSQHEYIEALADEPTRRQFYDKYNEFLNAYDEYTSLRDIDEEVARKCRLDLKKFAEVKKSANMKYDDKLDLRAYEREIARIINQHITAEKAEILTEPVEIANKQLFDEAVDELGNDYESRAEVIAAQANRRITELFKNKGDETLFEKFSERIRQIIGELHEAKIEDIKAFEQLSLITDEIEARKDDDLPSGVKKEKGSDILYRNLREAVPEANYSDAVINLARIVKQFAVVDWWKNFDQKRVIENALDDYIYDNLDVDEATNRKIREKVIELAENNHELFKD